MSGTEQRRLSAFDLWGALALACTSGITVVSLGRAFTDWTFLRTMLLLALGAHAAALALRTMRVSGWVAVPLLLLGGAWAIAPSYYGITMGGGVPHGATLDAFLADLRTVLDLFPTAVAPVPSRGAFAAPTAAAVVVAVVLSDTFAFRAGGHSEAVIPQGVLVAVIAAVGTPLWRTGLAAAWTASALLTVGALRARTRHRRGAWMGARPAPLSQAALRLGTIVASAALIGLAVGPHLPGSDAEALVDTEQRPSNITEIVSPLVDIRSELVSSGSRLLFTVESDDGPHYWRLLSLPTFDGRSWNPPEEDLSDLDGELPAASVVSNQRVTVAALGGPMVPAAYRPIDVDSDSDVYWAPDSESLVMPGRGLVSGTVIDIESAVPRRDPAILRATAAADAPSDEYLDVPSSVSPGVTATAVMVTDGTTTDFDRALALQQWFRTSFAYNTDVRFGNSANAIDEFLRVREGFCQQFAGTFAVMARTLGIPARVAVGFTPGEAVGPTTFRVYGRHAHAWPEVWFAGIGWVAFEPTPGRGSPDAADYLGVPAEQDDGPDAAPTTTTEPDATGSTTTTTAPGQTSSVPTTTVATGAGDPSSTTTPWAVLAGLALIAWGAAAPTLVARRMARRHHTRPARDRVVRSWYRAVTMIERSGGPTSSGATAHEFATATGDESPEDADDITALAGIVDRVVFSLEPVDDETATRADGLAARLAARRRERLGTVQRVVLRCTPWTEWRLPRSRPARHGD